MSPRWMTVLDMIKLFHVPDLQYILEHLSMLQLRFDERRDKGHGNVALTPEQIELIKKALSETMEYCLKVGFKEGMKKATTLFVFLQTMTHRYDTSAIATELNNVHGAIMGDIFDHRFVLVSGELTKYLDIKEPYGKEVSAAFPSAASDLVEAGNCLALGCNHAMVYHLMRAAEVGLRELGRDRQIPLAVSGKIDFSQWGEIMREIETAIQAIQQWPNSLVKEEAHKFYNKILPEARAFNDGWRRHSAHPRPHQPPMELDEALALWGHVQRFLQTLATRVGEGKYTPLVWV